MSNLVKDILLNIVGYNRTAEEALTHLKIIKSNWYAANKMDGFQSAIDRDDNRIKFLERYMVRDG